MTKFEPVILQDGAPLLAAASCCSFVASLLPGPPDPQASPHGVTVATSPAPPEKVGLRRFFDALHDGLPPGFTLDEDALRIRDEHGGVFCCPIRVASRARRPDGTGWMLETEFLDGDENLHRLSVSRTDLAFASRGFLAKLVDRGFRLACSPGELIQLLLCWDTPRSWRVDQPGWFTDDAGLSSFVRADGQVHQPDATGIVPVVYNAPTQAKAGSGNLAGWQDEVATQVVGNPALVFAISAGLAGPLLASSGFDTAGFNFFGPSGIGKSLLLKLALSGRGDPATLVPWAAAETGLHRLSAKAQDGLLALDGFPRDPDRRSIKALLALGDDAGAGRICSPHDPDGGQRWRRVLLSGSELPLSTCLHRKKKDVPAALATRVIDIPAAIGPHGLIAELHGAADGQSFARRLEAAMHRHHGHLLGAYLDRLVPALPVIRRELESRLPELARDLQAHCLSGPLSSPASRLAVAERFALVGFAGELGIRFGLLPWSEGSVLAAARTMAASVHSAPAHMGMDIETALGLLRDHVTKHRDRIVDLPSDRPADTPPGTVGWRDENYVYLDGEPIEKMLGDPNLFWNSLLENDVLKPGGEQRSRQYKMPARLVRERPRSYRVDLGALDETGYD